MATEAKPRAFRPEIWSWGHRNILGMDWDAQGRLWEVEHGPEGGDDGGRIVGHYANYPVPCLLDGTPSLAGVAVVGGGLAGLSAALSLARHGVRVEVTWP